MEGALKGHRPCSAWPVAVHPETTLQGPAATLNLPPGWPSGCDAQCTTVLPIAVVHRRGAIGTMSVGLWGLLPWHNSS